MHEIEALAVAECLKVAFEAIEIDFDVEGNQRVEAENRVVEIAVSVAIRKAAVVALLAAKEGFDELGGIAQKFWREARHLDHLEAKAHEDGPSAAGGFIERARVPILSAWRLRAVPESHRTSP